MRHSFYCITTLLIYLLSSHSLTAAEIGLSRQALAGSNPPIMVAAIIISGQIKTGDAKKVADLVDEMQQVPRDTQIRRLIIQSPGGLVGEAIEIGKLLHDNGIEVFIPAQLSCISACVLILAGGASRTIQGKVGIDRPHFINATSSTSALALLNTTQPLISDYLESMGVSKQLADAMFALPEGEVHFLTQEELSNYQLTTRQKR
jgi:hypothetical protein